MRILIVEDDEILAGTMAMALRDHACELAYSFAEACRKMEENTWDCYMLDVNLPDGSGMDLLRSLRQRASRVPILLVSSRTDEVSILEGYAMEADDYIEKPFRLAVLRAKVNAMARRQSALPSRNGQVEACGMRLDPVRLLLQSRDASWTLSQTETTLMKELMEASPRPVPISRLRTALFETTGRDVSDQTIAVRFSGLKRLLRTEPILIYNRRKAGYVLEAAKDTPGTDED